MIPRRMLVPIHLFCVACLAVMALSVAVPTPSALASPVATVTAALGATNTSLNGDGKAEPGDTISYTATVTNTGSANALGVNFADTPDGNTTLDTTSMESSPIAFPQSYNVIGNMPITVNAANGILVGDHDPDGDTPTLTVSGSETTTQNGSLSLSSDGSFTYVPPAGFQGTDTYTYTITDGTWQDSAAVTFNVSGMIWFINNSASSCTTLANFCGTLNHPFSDLGSFNTLNTTSGTNHPGTGDVIFIKQGSANYANALTLKNSQQLIGDGATSSITTLTGLSTSGATFSAALPTPQGSGHAPVLTSAATTLTLAQTNKIDGLSVNTTGGSSGTAIAGTSGGDTALVIEETSVNTMAGASGQALNLNHYVLTTTFPTVNASNAATGIAVSNTTGAFEIDGGTVQSITTNGASFSSAHDITLKNMTFSSADTGTDASCNDQVGVTCDAAINLSSVGPNSSDPTGTAGVTLSGVTVNTASQVGIYGSNVTNFVMTNGEVKNAGSGTGTCSGGGNCISQYEMGLMFSNLLGTSSINGTNIHNNGVLDLEVRNNTGSLTLSITGATLGLTGCAGCAGDQGKGGIQFLGDSTAVMNLDVEGSTFSQPDGTVILANATTNGATHTSAQLGVKIGVTSGNTITGNGFNATAGAQGNCPGTVGGAGGGIVLGTQDTGKVKFDIENNHIRCVSTADIDIDLGQGSNTTATLISGKIANNAIGESVGNLPANLGGGNGIQLQAFTAGQENVSLLNNTLWNVSGGQGVEILNDNGAATANITGYGNTVDVDHSNEKGLNLANGVSTGGDTSTTCLDWGNGSGAVGSAANNMSDSILYVTSTGADPMVLSNHSSQAVSLPGYTGPAVSGQTVPTFEGAHNTTNSGAVRVASSGTAGWTGGSSCTAPSVPSFALARVAHTRASVKPHSDASAVHGATTVLSPHTSGHHVSAHRGFVHAMANFGSGNTVNIGTLPAGHHVTITFQATVHDINNPEGATSATNSVAVTGSNFTEADTSANTPLNRLNSQVSVVSNAATDAATGPNPSVFGQAVTFKATVTAAAGTGTPSGSVEFWDGPAGTGTDLGVGSDQGGGVWTFQTNVLDAANSPHTVTAAYGGDDRFNGQNGATSQTVNKADTSSTISSISPSTTVSGQAATVNFGVSVNSPGSNGPGNPTGSVTISDGSGDSCIGSLSSGTGSCDITLPHAGVPSLTVTYASDPNFNGSSQGGFTHTVNKADTTATVHLDGSSGDPSPWGSAVTFDAGVSVDSPGGGTPTGTLAFVADAGTAQELALCSNVSASTPSCTTSTLSVGHHTITVTYSGDSDFIGSSGTVSGGQDVNDKTGPVTSNLGTPDATSGPPTFTATVDDSITGSSTIQAAEYFIDTLGSDGTGTTMGATDGNFSSVSEDVTATMSQSAWDNLTPGSHTLYIHGQDSAGNWGAAQSVTFAGPAATNPGTSNGAASPASIKSNAATTTLSIDVTPGLHPQSGNLMATVDLQAIGGSATQVLTDNGSGTFSVQNITVPEGTLPMTYDFPVHVSDAQGRSASGSIPLTVTSATGAHVTIVSNVSNNTQAEATVGGSGPFTTGSYTAVARDGSPPDTLYVAGYDKNPVDGAAPTTGTVTYFDVKLSPNNGFDDVTITDCNLSSTSNIYWYDSTGTTPGWRTINNSDLTVVSTSPECLSFRSVPSAGTGGTPGAPTMEQLVGTVFASLGGTPTDAVLAHSSLVRHGASLTVKWRVADSSGIIGFRVFAGARQLSQHVIPVHASHAYHLTTTYAGHQPITLHILESGGRQVITPIR